MRKFAFLSIIMGLFVCNAAFAKQNCVVTACPTKSDKIGVNKEFIYANSGGGGQCYSCDSDDYNSSDDECAYDAIVGQKNPDGRYVSLYRCTDVSGATDEWRNFNPTLVCTNSPVKNPTKNTETYYLTKGSTKSEPVAVGDHTMVSAGNSACVYYVCKSGLMPNADKTDCVKDNRNPKCASNNGNTYAVGQTLPSKCNTSHTPASLNLNSLNKVKSNASCTGTCVADGWNITLNSDSCETNYEPDSAKKKCVESQASRNQRQQRQAQAAKEKCENSGGTWSSGKCKCDNSKNLRLESGECVCLDSTNYRRDGNQCILTDAAALQRECEGAATTGAYWDASTKQCRCSNPQHAFINKQCRMNPAIEACNQIPGAKWNQVANECRCTDPQKELNADGTACVETDEARQEREESEATAQLSAAKTKITKSASALKNMSEGFKVSVWKNKEGNFNTARLASDSIAGVVLGTAGGLITSNVVKKNQVKNGFEDIQCTIGGQVVADWGDEFRVGIQ